MRSVRHSRNPGSPGIESAYGLGKDVGTSRLAFWGKGGQAQQTGCSEAGAPGLGAAAERSQGTCKVGGGEAVAELS